MIHSAPALAQGQKSVCLPATKIAVDLSYPRGANLVMLGALCACLPLFAPEDLARGLEDFFCAKGKTDPRNLSCFPGRPDEILKKGGN